MSHPISRVGFGLLPKHIHFKTAGLHPEIRTKGFFFFLRHQQNHELLPGKFQGYWYETLRCCSLKFPEKREGRKFIYSIDVRKTQTCIAWKSYFFSWVGQNGTLCVPGVFITFKRMKISHYFTSKEREKTIYLKFTQIFCGLLSLFSDYFCAKVKCIGAMLTAVSLAAVVWSHHTTPSIPHLREHHCVTRSNNGWERDYAYSCSSNRKKSKLLIYN